MRRAKTKASERKSGKSANTGRRTSSFTPALRGLGPYSLGILRSAGIGTRADLERLGPVRAYIAAKKIEPRVTLNLLWGIAGAITDTHWTKIPAEYRSSLLLEYDAYQDAARAATLNR